MHLQNGGAALLFRRYLEFVFSQLSFFSIGLGEAEESVEGKERGNENGDKALLYKYSTSIDARNPKVVAPSCYFAAILNSYSRSSLVFL